MALWAHSITVSRALHIIFPFIDKRDNPQLASKVARDHFLPMTPKKSLDPPKNVRSHKKRSIGSLSSTPTQVSSVVKSESQLPSLRMPLEKIRVSIYFAVCLPSK